MSEMVEQVTRTPRCAVGIGGDFKIPGDGLDPGGRWSWHITWLPRGYAPTVDAFTICLVDEPPGEDWSKYGLAHGRRPPLVEAICTAIEAHMIDAALGGEG